MSIDTKTLQKEIVGEKLIPEARFAALAQKAERSKKPLEEVLVEEGVLDSEKMLQIQGRLLGVPVVDLRKNKIPKDILSLIPEPIARRHNVIAFAKDEKKGELHLAMLDPDDLQTREFIKKTTGLNVKPFLTTKEGVEYGLALYHNNLEAEFQKILGTEQAKAVMSGTLGEEDQGKLATIAEQIPVVRVVDTLLEYAIYEKASDIHIEAQGKKVVVRYRIDGILHDVMSLPKIILPAVVARIKVLSSLKIDEHRLPQDGRFQKELGETKISFRVSTIPSFDGEKVAMRLLEESAKASTLEELGFRGKALEVINRNIRKSHGATLVTGPTGSGKSTTLYSILSLLNTREVNISTIEDPVEYRIEGVNQMQVNPKIGLTFAIGLRSLLRQDPNIIMIGEIRDKETAEEAIHAAMTGHVVLSTLHTNSASAAFPRLLDMDVEPFLIASTVNTIIAQRLVRILCKHCKSGYKLTKEQTDELAKQFDLDVMMRILVREGIVNEEVQSLGEVLFFKAVGCDKCNDTGYTGRKGIYEVVEVSESIADLILKRASSGEIQEKAVQEGTVLLWQDGIIKAHMGMTTIEEVLRVSRE